MDQHAQKNNSSKRLIFKRNLNPEYYILDKTPSLATGREDGEIIFVGQFEELQSFCQRQLKWMFGLRDLQHKISENGFKKSRDNLFEIHRLLTDEEMEINISNKKI